MPSSSSGTIHHMLTAAHAASQPPSIAHARPRRGPVKAKKSSIRPAGMQAAAVLTALTAPVHSTARPDSNTARAVARQGSSSRRAATRRSGSRIHGASATGQVSDEIAPNVVITRGDNAYNNAASTREVCVPTPIASATRYAPVKAKQRVRLHHSAWISQPGARTSGSKLNSAKNAPCGKR